jgi:sugar/nucleoside kinase (ribokinase family)
VAGRPTTTKTRVVARTQQIVRIDEEIETLIEGAELERLTALAVAALDGADAVLLEDYNKGALAPPPYPRRHRYRPPARDPRHRRSQVPPVFRLRRGDAVQAQPARARGRTRRGHRSGAPGQHSRRDQALGVDNLLLTLGADGMVLVTKDGVLTHIPSLAREVFDVSGAGDTVTAWTGTMLAAGAHSGIRTPGHVRGRASKSARRSSDSHTRGSARAARWNARPVGNASKGRSDLMSIRRTLLLAALLATSQMATPATRSRSRRPIRQNVPNASFRRRSGGRRGSWC